MSSLEPLGKSLSYLPYSLGYSLTSTWATVPLFSSAFSATPSAAIVTVSMLSGVVACLGALLLHSKAALFNGRGAASSVYATCVAVGTLLCTFPDLASIRAVHDAGLVVSGFFAILLLLTWFEAFSRLSSRTVVFLGGCSFLFSSVGVFAVLALPVEVASVAVSAIPIISFSLLPKPSPTPRQPAAPSRATLGATLTQALSWKTLLGIALSFFVIGAMGALAPELGVSIELSPVYLGVPAALAAVFILTCVMAPQRLDGSALFKLLLIGVAATAFLLVYAGFTNLTLVFFLYITADVLLWTVLALAAKKTPVAPHAVFATGWLAECAGNVLGHQACAAIGNTSMLFALVMLLILVAVGFAFGDGLFIIDLGEDAGDAGADNGGVTDGMQPIDKGFGADGERDADHAGSTSKTGKESSNALGGAGGVATFAAKYGLSERETEVFALWVTGHGLKHIQNVLFISESTVKTHLRSIYRKCGTHNRAEIIELYETQS